jgi:hypothetical protein
MKSNTVEITVTKKNFDAAAAALAKYKDLASTCLLAQAIKEAYPKKKVSVSIHSRISTWATVGTKTFNLPARAQKLIERFDRLRFFEEPTTSEKKRAARLRASLPISFTMTEEVQQAAAVAA